MVVGPCQRQRPEQREEGLRAAPCVARRPSAGTRSGRTRMVGIVRVEVLCQRQSGEAESLATQCLLQGLEVPRVGPLGTDAGIDFSRDRGYERCAPTTLATALAVASARRRTVCKRVSKSWAFTLPCLRNASTSASTAAFNAANISSLKPPFQPRDRAVQSTAPRAWSESSHPRNRPISARSIPPYGKSSLSCRAP